MQIPGVDFIERFSPVASDTTTRIIIALTLYHEGWSIESIDIEATFLKGDVKEPSFLKWLPGMVILGLINEAPHCTKCI